MASAAPAADEDEARSLREEKRRRHHDATHHVFAWRSASGDGRWDDDGEPAGTAGRPLLGAIESAGVADVALVVTRWFGGTKLGTGGLARAYGGAGALALARLPVAVVRPGRRLRVRHAWEDTGAVATVLEALGARRTAERHGTEAEIDVTVAERQAGILESALREATAGRARVRALPGTVRVPVHP